jgi:predicted Zn-dependent protease with MMP-like domain
VTRREFEDSVRRALDSLPPHIADGLENVAVVVEDEDRDDPDAFGLFREELYLPATIVIFQKPLEEAFPDRADLEREIRVTVLHEVGHYFGLEEDEIADLGYD